MAFKNEKISGQDQAWVTALVNYENIRALSKWVHRFPPPDWIWTVDRERGACLIDLGGGGSPDDIGRMPYAVLIIDGRMVLFNYVCRRHGNKALGLDIVYEVHGLIIPSTLATRSEAVRQLIREGFMEYTSAAPFADGGTYVKPNLGARLNLKSFDLEFK